MAKEAKQFSDKYNLLPEEVQYYFSNEFCGGIILYLAKDYNIDSSHIYGLVFDTVNHDFDFNYVKNELLALNLKDLKTDVFFRDFIGKIFLPINQYIKNINIKEELSKNGGDPKSYQENVDKFFSLIEDENFNDFDSLIDLHEKIVNPGEEKAYIIDLFSAHLLEVLASDSSDAIMSLNGGLIYLLNTETDDSFKKDLENALYSNQEKISENRINFEDREVEGTISNYLRDFIKKNGSEFFSGVVLAQYLSNSANTKKLNAQQKHLISQLLKLYRNLSFFPDSMGNLPTVRWQIIPYDEKPKEIPTSTAKPSGSNKLSSPSKPVVKEVSKITHKEIINTAPESVLPNSSENILDELSELNKEILDYPENSLEYKALKQEIERFKKSKKFKI